MLMESFLLTDAILNAEKKQRFSLLRPCVYNICMCVCYYWERYQTIYNAILGILRTHDKTTN